jgi:hypothetical protein
MGVSRQSVSCQGAPGAGGNFGKTAGSVKFPKPLIFLAQPDLVYAFFEYVANPQFAGRIDAADSGHPIRVNEHALPELRAAKPGLA